MWKSMNKDEKEKYFELAREVDAEHKRKYPGELFLIILLNYSILRNYGFLKISEY